MLKSGLGVKVQLINSYLGTGKPSRLKYSTNKVAAKKTIIPTHVINNERSKSQYQRCSRQRRKVGSFDVQLAFKMRNFNHEDMVRRQNQITIFNRQENADLSSLSFVTRWFCGSLYIIFSWYQTVASETNVVSGNGLQFARRRSSHLNADWARSWWTQRSTPLSGRKVPLAHHSPLIRSIDGWFSSRDGRVGNLPPEKYVYLG